MRDLKDSKDYVDLTEFIEKFKKEDRACEEIYESRLNICKECDDLVAGTCLKCGCYVELRAAVMRNKCPMKKW